MLARKSECSMSHWTATGMKEKKIDDELEADEKAGYLKPEYTLIYKQAVTPNDIYLQMSSKNPSTICCEDLVMRVSLPDVETVDDMKLDVKPTHVKLSASIYFLAMHLPHKVDAVRSCAKWDAANCMLEITMPILERDLLA
ncbi:hypothetical protein O6H91_15G065700 [Diphasiastrum complanatum]|uniref:Uncharacterized protein n=1 Tax=Diphasiastrum complanatum TaxID=34168 RepID=A0ACC2BJ88_DIPCM|nr:hypothetical protein O6H91_15G065700 [Diphasiastrum complanatum]